MFSFIGHVCHQDYSQGPLHMHSLASWLTILYPGHGFREKLWAPRMRTRCSQYRRCILRNGLTVLCCLAHCFWHRTVWQFVCFPYCCFRGGTNLTPIYIPNCLQTKQSKKNQKKNQEEQAWKWRVLKITMVMVASSTQIYIILAHLWCKGNVPIIRLNTYTAIFSDQNLLEVEDYIILYQKKSKLIPSFQC